MRLMFVLHVLCPIAALGLGQLILTRQELLQRQLKESIAGVHHLRLYSLKILNQRYPDGQAILIVIMAAGSHQVAQLLLLRVQTLDMVVETL